MIVISSLVDAKSKRKEDQAEKRRKSSNGFKNVFDEACGKLQTHGEISYQTSGYTRDAKSFCQNVNMKEYV